MRYLDRLISRALAIPRDGAAALFDPFEQVADWPLDSAAPAIGVHERGPAAAVTIPTEPSVPATTRGHAVAAGEPVSASLQPPPSGSPIAGPIQAEPQSTPARPTASPGPTPPPVSAAIVPEPAARVRTPLDMATDFMRSVAPAMVPDEPEPVRPPVARAAPPSLPDAPAVASRTASRNTARPVAADAVTPMTVVPPAPKPHLPPFPTAGFDGTAALSRAATLPPPPPAAAARPDRPRPPKPTFATVERAITVGRAAPPRDELAHGVGIMRFGIGQG